MKSALLPSIKIFIYLVVIAAGLTLAWQHREVISTTITTHGGLLLTLIALGITQLYLQSRNFVDLLETSSSQSHLAWLQLWSLSSLSNYIAPFQPGLAVRAGVLKHWLIPIHDTTRATIKQLHLSLWSATLLLSIALLFSSTINLAIIPWLGIGIALLWLGLMAMQPPQPKTDVHIKNWIRSIWYRPSFKQITLVSGNYLISAIALFIAYNTLGATLTASDALLLATITTLSGLVTILPGNLGVQEFLLWYAAGVVGLSAELAIVIPVLMRFSHIATCVLLLIVTKLLCNFHKPVQ